LSPKIKEIRTCEWELKPKPKKPMRRMSFFIEKSIAVAKSKNRLFELRFQTYLK
jgi:hypothetical protein